MRSFLRGAPWLLLALLAWLVVWVGMVLMAIYDAATGWVNRRFDALYKDF